jgi:hypothetical protein
MKLNGYYIVERVLSRRSLSAAEEVAKRAMEYRRELAHKGIHKARKINRNRRQRRINEGIINIKRALIRMKQRRDPEGLENI